MLDEALVYREQHPEIQKDMDDEKEKKYRRDLKLVMAD